MSRVALAALILPLLAACGGTVSSDATTGDLSSACAIVECDCIKSSIGTFTIEDPVPVEWAKNGSAQCPAGRRLRRLK